MIRRELYLKRIEMYVGRNEVKLITGVRRCGKTVIIKQLIEEMKESGIPEENILYLNFESLLYTYFNEAAGLREMLAEFLASIRGHVYVFLDELRDIPGWAGVLAELMQQHDCEFFVISSNSHLFYDGFARELGYRYVRIEVFPLVFSEYLDFVRQDEAMGEQMEAVIAAMFPEGEST